MYCSYTSTMATNATTIQHFRFCGCCDDSVFKLSKQEPESIVNGTHYLGMKNIVQHRMLGELDEYGLHLVEWCFDFYNFLKIYEDGDEWNNENPHPIFVNKNENAYHKRKMVSIWKFVYGFLGIRQYCGYDYWLLCFLDWNCIVEHGSGIRCAWLSDLSYPEIFSSRIYKDDASKIEQHKRLLEEFKNRALSTERHKTLYQWVDAYDPEKCGDDLTEFYFDFYQRRGGEGKTIHYINDDGTFSYGE